MQEPLFEVTTTVYVDTEKGATGAEWSHEVRVVARYRQHDGRVLGERNCRSLAEAQEFAREIVAVFMRETQP